MGKGELASGRATTGARDREVWSMGARRHGLTVGATESWRWHAELMAASENLTPLLLPDDRTWSSVGVVRSEELHGGYQPRVFAGTCGGERVVVKLTDCRLVDQGYRRRVEMTSLLAELDDSVVGPLTTKSGVIVDFDDCGYGPIEFDAGNTLYMVLFDAAMSSEMQRYGRFRGWFVDEYRSASGHGVSDELVDTSIALRVQALGRWLDRPESAPIGIRTATPAWRDSLRAFVRSQTSP